MIGNECLSAAAQAFWRVSICDGVVIGAGSVVTKSITEKGVVGGDPAKLLRRYNKMPTMGRHLRTF